jgi:hypothetical protein
MVSPHRNFLNSTAQNLRLLYEGLMMRTELLADPIEPAFIGEVRDLCP